MDYLEQQLENQLAEIHRVEDLEQFWWKVFPKSRGIPERTWLFTWARKFDPEDMKRAILQTRKKDTLLGNTMSTQDLGRYAHGVARSITEQKQKLKPAIVSAQRVHEI